METKDTEQGRVGHPPELEGMLYVPLTAGLTGDFSSLPDAADAVQNGVELLRNGNNGQPNMAKQKCPANCN